MLPRQYTLELSPACVAWLRSLPGRSYADKILPLLDWCYDEDLLELSQQTRQIPVAPVVVEASLARFATQIRKRRLLSDAVRTTYLLHTRASGVIVPEGLGSCDIR